MTKEKSNTTNLLLWLNDGIDIKNRSVYVTEVEEYDMANIVRGIKIMELESASKPITVYISSYGGNVYDGLALYDTLRSLECPVETHVLGKAMSMGVILFAAGDTRSASPHATFMAHEISSGSAGKLHENKIDVEEAERLNKILLGILVERTSKSAKWWSKFIEYKDQYFDSKEAKKMGLINEA